MSEPHSLADFENLLFVVTKTQVLNVLVRNGYLVADGIRSGNFGFLVSLLSVIIFVECLNFLF